MAGGWLAILILISSLILIIPLLYFANRPRKRGFLSNIRPDGRTYSRAGSYYRAGNSAGGFRGGGGGGFSGGGASGSW